MRDAYEKGRIIGLHKSGVTINEIVKLVNWSENDIERVLEEESNNDSEECWH